MSSSVSYCMSYCIILWCTVVAHHALVGWADIGITSLWALIKVFYTLGTDENVTEPSAISPPHGVIDSSVLQTQDPFYSDQLTRKCSDFKLIDGELRLQKTGGRGYYMKNWCFAQDGGQPHCKSRKVKVFQPSRFKTLFAICSGTDEKGHWNSSADLSISMHTKPTKDNTRYT